MKKLISIIFLGLITIGLLWAQPDIGIFRKQIIIDRIEEPFINPLMATVYIEEKGVGTGVILTEDGYILTAAHIVEDSSVVSIYLSLFPTHEYKAQLIYKEDLFDLAILKMETDLILPTIKWGSSKEVKIANEVFLVGHPYRFGWTVSRGIVSSLRFDDYGIAYIQTDASAHPGNSGGGLFNDKGEFIGLFSFIYVRLGYFGSTSLNVGWASASDIIKVISGGIIQVHRLMIENLRRVN
ncbi:hypothetical protein LCGC14_2397930 [marine sediment metagenome]|uniref:Serine protease n=1 Tax=marine sediment metagenome TaxID=412755 RepID=A0A0F9BWA4_9ZZZZ